MPMKAGWRSPALLLPAEHVGHRDRLTTYLRLRDCTPIHPWSYSLIRLETFRDPGGIAQIEALAAYAMTQVQHLSSGDPRAEIQLAGNFWAERVLKARIPHAPGVFS